MCFAHQQAAEEDDGNVSDSSMDSGSTSGPNFNYILNMPLWCLTKEKVEELLKQRDQKVIVAGFLIRDWWLFIALVSVALKTTMSHCLCAGGGAERPPEEIT